MKPILNFPTPSNINYLWNFGSLLGLCLVIQIVSGLFLATYYTPNIGLSFDELVNFINNVNQGWLIRFIHSNGASIFFICVYVHIGKALFYGSYDMMEVWFTGIIIFFILIGTAFLGYVLPWGQMSYWGATVITNLISVVPFIGSQIVEWLWGGFNIHNATLTRFYTFHFLFPFLIALIAITHLIFLHIKGSSNPLGLNPSIDKITFSPFFFVKDLVSLLIFITLFFSLIHLNPLLFFDVENFISRNPMVTPLHIQPEWYFLFAYAILRSIPRKLGGVIILVISISILAFLPLVNFKKIKGLIFTPMKELILIFHFGTFLFLTYLGRMVVEYPYTYLRGCYTLIYFLSFLVI